MDYEKIKEELKKVLKFYREIAKDIDEDIEFLYGSDYQVDINKKQVFIPLLVSEQGNLDFANSIMKILETTENKAEAEMVDIMMWSVYHEIGHIKSKQGDLKSKILRKLANFLSRHNIKKLSRKIYYNIPEEVNASKWACEYVSKNCKKVKKMQEQLMKKYNEFYVNLGVREGEIM